MIYRVTLADMRCLSKHGSPRVTMEMTVEAENEAEAKTKAINSQFSCGLPDIYKLQEVSK